MDNPISTSCVGNGSSSILHIGASGGQGSVKRGVGQSLEKNLSIICSNMEFLT